MRRFWTWAPPFALVILIFWLSSLSHYPGDIPLPSPLDKVAHASVFAALAFLLDRALRRSRHDLPLYRRHLWVFLAVAFYGATDEWHQAFVPGRDCSALDWLADATGAALGLVAAAWPFLMGSRDATFGWWIGRRERPDPRRPLILVADPHWGEELIGLREMTRRFPEADWLLLGDVFEVWVGLRGLETEAQRSLLWWVQERRNAGRWIGLWAGNRDYFLDRYASQFDLLGEGTGGDLPAEDLVFEHGDLVNGSDRRYRYWNLVSRSAFAWLLVRLLSASLAQRLARKLERSMRGSNEGYRLTFPRAAFEHAAREAQGRTFVTGHFHIHEEAGNGVALPWAHEGAFVLWDRGRLELLPAPLRSDATFFQSKRP